MLLCRTCNKEKPESEFKETNRSKCISCIRAYQRAYRQKKRRQGQNPNPKTRNNRKPWRLTPAQLKAQAKKQGYRCTICKKKKPLLQDHCHKRLKFRGLLCHSCNIALGLFGDNPKRLRRAARYVTDSS